MYFVFLFVEGPVAHTGQLMLRERQQKETNLRYNQLPQRFCCNTLKPH